MENQYAERSRAAGEVGRVNDNRFGPPVGRVGEKDEVISERSFTQLACLTERFLNPPREKDAPT